MSEVLDARDDAHGVDLGVVNFVTIVIPNTLLSTLKLLDRHGRERLLVAGLLLLLAALGLAVRLAQEAAAAAVGVRVVVLVAAVAGHGVFGVSCGFL